MCENRAKTKPKTVLGSVAYFPALLKNIYFVLGFSQSDLASQMLTLVFSNSMHVTACHFPFVNMDRKLSDADVKVVMSSAVRIVFFLISNRIE